MFDPTLHDKVRQELVHTFESLGRKLRRREGEHPDYVYANYLSMAGRILTLNGKEDAPVAKQPRGL